MTEIPWETLKGAYREQYDPRIAVAEVARGGDWSSLWEELHHQGDVDTASYAAVPMIADLAERGFGADWNSYALPVAIELARQGSVNPPIPDWAADAYRSGLERLFAVGLAVLPSASEELLIASIISLFAAHKQLPQLARAGAMSEDERRDLFDDAGWG
jgi:hypothetical protein